MSLPTRRATLRRRGAAISVTLAVATLVVAGCTPAASPEDGGGGEGGDFTIYWNAGHAYETYERVITEFGKEHDLKINWQKYQWPDLNTKLAADLRSGNVPDLVEQPLGGDIVQRAAAGEVIALDDYLAEDGKDVEFPDDFQPASVTAVQYEDSTFGLPLHFTANGLVFYNKTMLADAGYDAPPKTWDELREIAKATTHENVYGFALNSDPFYGESWITQNGAKISNASEDEFLEPQKNADEAMQFLQDLVFTDKVAPVPVATTDYAGPQKLFSAGRAAMFVSGPWDLLPVREGSGDIDWAIAPPLTQKKQSSALAGAGMVIPEGAKHADLAWELMQRLTSLDVELEVTAETGMSMPRVSWGQAEEIKSDENLAVVAEALSVAQEPDVSLAASGANAAVADLWKTAYQSIVIQQASVADALQSYREQAVAALPQ